MAQNKNRKADMLQQISHYTLDMEQCDGSNNSDYNFSLKQAEPPLDPPINDYFDDSQSDQGIRQYNTYIIDNYLKDPSFFHYCTQKQQHVKQNSSNCQVKESDSKSLYSGKSIPTLYTSRTFNTPKITEGTQDIYTDNYQNKKKYLKQEARKIKKQLKQEQQKFKKEKKEFKDIDIHLDRRTKHYVTTTKGGKRRITKRTLQLLSQKFDEMYAAENDIDFRGPRLHIKQIGLLFDIKPSTIHKLLKEWEEDPSFYSRINKQTMKEKGPEKKITIQRLEHLNRLIKENPFLTQNQLTVELNKIQDLKFQKDGQKIDITRTTISRLLKVGKFKKKRVKCVPKERNTSKSLEKRQQYCSMYHDIYMKRARIFFLDESGFNLYMTRDKAWSRPNEEVNVNCPINKGKRFSLIAVIAEDGLTHWRIIQGTYRKYEFLDFIRHLFNRIRQDMDQMNEDQRAEDSLREKWLILDNCAIHDREQTQKLAQNCQMNILYLPPYSPQLNPIEMWFSEVKAKVRKTNYSGERQLLQIMQRTLRQYQNFDFSNYFSGIMKHVTKGINKQKF